jgi:very-short-patch-repair endonuclease
VNTWAEGYEVEFFWPEAALVVEVDGGATHHTGRAFHEDRRRDRALAVAGIQVVRVPWRDLRDGPARIAADLLAILERRR